MIRPCVCVLLFLGVSGAMGLTGCTSPRWVTVSDAHPDPAINGAYMGRVVVMAVREAVAYEAGATPYTFVLPRRATPGTYAEVQHGLGDDARVPAGIPAVTVDPATGRAQRRDVEVVRAERASPPQASPTGDLPVVEVRELRLSGQTGEVDIVRPLVGGRRVLTVSLKLDAGAGWRTTGVRLWRALDPDSGL